MKTALCLAAFVVMFCGSAALAKDTSAHCHPLAEAKLPIQESADRSREAKGLKPVAVSYVEASKAEFVFLQGIYVGNPNTPPGLPMATGALIGRADGLGAAAVLFTFQPSASKNAPLVCASALMLPKAVADLLPRLKGSLGGEGDEI